MGEDDDDEGELVLFHQGIIIIASRMEEHGTEKKRSKERLDFIGLTTMKTLTVTLRKTMKMMRPWAKRGGGDLDRGLEFELGFQCN